MNYHEKKEKESEKDFFPARPQGISKIFKSEKVYVGEMQECYNLTEKLQIALDIILDMQIPRKTAN